MDGAGTRVRDGLVDALERVDRRFYHRGLHRHARVAAWWQTMFLKNGPPTLRLIENALVGPIIAILSFVCSVGNIPLASHFWANGSVSAAWSRLSTAICLSSRSS